MTCSISGRLSAVLFVAFSATVLGQVAPNPSSSASSADDKEAPVLELSPFVVTAEDDGYIAGDTLAGGRLKTNLADTAVQIDVMTMQLIEDIGAVNLDEALLYATNSALDISAGEESDNLQIEAPTGRFNIRGLPANRTRNFLPIAHNADVYNITRFEEQRGPNSILYGIGSPAGIINANTKRAILGDSFHKASLMGSSAGGFRGTLDLNQDLGERFALRLNTVYSDLDDPIAEHAYTKTEGAHLAFTAKITDKIRFWAEGERVDQDSVAPIARTPDEHVSTWLYNSPLPAVIFANNANPGLNLAQHGLASLGNARRVTYIANDGTVQNFQGLHTTTGTGNITWAQNFPELWDNSANPGGPNNLRQNEFYSFGGGLEVAFSRKTFLELSFNRNGLETESAGFIAEAIRATPNQFYRDGTPNPHVGQFYVEGQYRMWDRSTDYTSYRATLSHEQDFGKFGNYRLALMYERDYEENTNVQRREAWVDANGMGLYHSDPRNGNNVVRRRVYFNPFDPAGIDWSQVNASGPGANGFINGIQVEGVTAYSAWRNQSSFLAGENEYETALIGLQARYFQNRLIIGAGYRRDTLDQRVFDIRDANNAFILNEFRERWYTPDSWVDTEYSGKTKTLGAVYHINKNFRLMYNQSDNFGISPQVRFSYPDNGPMANTEGKGYDFGVGFSFLDGKLTGRLTRFKTEATNAVAFNFNLTNINSDLWDALVTHTAVTGITQADADANFIQGTGGTFDQTIEGYEFSLTANVTKSWSITARYAYNEGFRSNSWPDQRLYIEGDANGKFHGREALPFFENPAWANLLMDSGETIGAYVADFKDDVAVEVALDGVALAKSIPHSANLFTRYAFREGWLKGFVIGGGVRYQSATDLGMGLDVNGDFVRLEGNSRFESDLMLSYKFRKLFGLNNVSVQLNVKNALDNEDPRVNRKLADGTIRNITYWRPREWRLSTNFSF